MKVAPEIEEVLQRHRSPKSSDTRRNGHGNQQLMPKLIKSSGDFVAGFVPPDYLVDGMLQRRFCYSLTGRTGSGKTAIVLLLTACIGKGQSLGPCEVAQGRVLYFAGENPDDVRMRWIAMAQHMDFDLGAIQVDFIPGTFKISQLANRITKEVEERGEVGLVVVDTSAAYFEGDDENSNTQQAQHARRLRSLVNMPGGPCVLVLCHPVKNATPENLIPRGGGSFIAEIDGNLTCNKEDTIVELHWQGKFRGADFAPVAFLLKTVTHERLKDSKGRLIPTVIASHLSETGQEELAAVARGNEVKLLAEIQRNGKASLAELARAVGWFLKNGEPYKMLVKRTMAALVKYKLITIERDGITLTSKGRAVLRIAEPANSSND
jgi:energy-coupling factor transporter ATP-binding protein EcfA2